MSSVTRATTGAQATDLKRYMRINWREVMGLPPKWEPIVTITGEDVRAWRLQVGLAQETLSARLGYTHAVVGLWETGRQRVPPHMYRRLLDVLLEAQATQQQRGKGR